MFQVGVAPGKSRWIPLLFVAISLGLFFWMLPISIRTLPYKLSGLLFTFLGTGLYFYLYPRVGLIPLILFHFLVGNLFILLPVLPTHLFGFLFFSLCLVFLPSTLLHFTFLISGVFLEIKNKVPFIVVYLLSGLIWALYFYAGLYNPTLRDQLTTLILVYLFIAYFFWILRMVIILKGQYPQMDKVMVRYLLLGQLLGVLLPLSLFGIVWFAGMDLPSYLLAPLILLFPLSILFSLIPAMKHQIQTYLVQSEKRVALGDLLTNLSHELNNPLNFVYASLDPLKEHLQTIQSQLPAKNEIISEAFANIDKLMTHMKDGLVRSRDLLVTFRDFPTAQKAEKEKIQIESLIDKCIELLAHRWKDRIQIKKNYEANSTILGRPLELEQAFTNLLANACDATPKGGTVLISTHQASGGFKIVIRDTGKGISREVISRIFDPFFTTKPQGEGKGIGLAITLQIIKNHKGSIDVNSEVGKGTEFMVFLPY